MSKIIDRRKFLHMSAAGFAGLLMYGCSPSATEPAAPAQPIEVTRIVEVEGTPVVEVVTATPEPTTPPRQSRISWELSPAAKP